jgi:hypothetical protein
MLRGNRDSSKNSQDFARGPREYRVTKDKTSPHLDDAAGIREPRVVANDITFAFRRPSGRLGEPVTRETDSQSYSDGASDRAASTLDTERVADSSLICCVSPASPVPLPSPISSHTKRTSIAR